MSDIIDSIEKARKKIRENSTKTRSFLCPACLEPIRFRGIDHEKLEVRYECSCTDKINEDKR
jgi:predicted RNA-binding Zn-ribbon protein involved in translation (DUF1610 family)